MTKEQIEAQISLLRFLIGNCMHRTCYGYRDENLKERAIYGVPRPVLIEQMKRLQEYAK